MTIALVIGFFIARWLWLKYFTEKQSIDHFYNISFYLVIFSLLGARLYHVLNQLSYYWQNPLQILSIWNGGLALHGALLAGVLVILWYVKKHNLLVSSKMKKANDKQITKPNSQNGGFLNIGNWRMFGILHFRFEFLTIVDIFAPAMVLGQAIGRWGNYFNQELYGIPTNLPWGIPIELVNRMPGFTDFTYFHPTFLYESLLNLVVFGVLISLHKKQLATSNWQLAKKPEARSQKLEAFHPGTITAIYIILYSFIRLSLELIRIDTTPIIFGIRLPILVSIVLIVAGIVFIFRQKKIKT